MLAELPQVFIDSLFASGSAGRRQDIRHCGGDFRTRATAVEQREQAQRDLIVHLDRFVPQIGHPESAPGLPARDAARQRPLARERYERRPVQR